MHSTMDSLFPSHEEFQKRCIEELKSRFRAKPQVIGIAPGRVELLGNHTDHNRGLVLSSAIDRYTWVAAAANGESCVRVRALNLQSDDQFELPVVAALPRGTWSNYVRGTIAALIHAEVPVQGFDACIASNVPLGGGLSSSASLECAVAMAVLGLFGRRAANHLAGISLAKTLQQAEHDVVGVRCGILDQFSSLFGQADHAMFLDCDNLEYDILPLGSEPPVIVVFDSNAPRELTKGSYNDMRAECEAASEVLHRINPQFHHRTVPSLRDIPLDIFAQCEAVLDPKLARRARHVLTENQRVIAGRELLRKRSDVRAFGRLMLESHRSSRLDFENSSPQLDQLIELASDQPGFLGGKLSGAGWGGCTVNLVESAHAGSFARSVQTAYNQRTGLESRALICHAAQGARVSTNLD